MLQGILMNINDQMKSLSTQAGKSKKQKSAAPDKTHKSKSSTMVGPMPKGNALQSQLYEQMKSQQFSGVSSETAEQIQRELAKNGFNLSQLNKILGKIEAFQSNQMYSKSESGLRKGGHGHASSSSGRRQVSKGAGSGGSRGRYLEQSPDS